MKKSRLDTSEGTVAEEKCSWLHSWALSPAAVFAVGREALAEPELLINPRQVGSAPGSGPHWL